MLIFGLRLVANEATTFQMSSQSESDDAHNCFYNKKAIDYPEECNLNPPYGTLKP